RDELAAELYRLGEGVGHRPQVDDLAGSYRDEVHAVPLDAAAGGRHRSPGADLAGRTTPVDRHGLPVGHLADDLVVHVRPGPRLLSMPFPQSRDGVLPAAVVERVGV